MRAELVELAMGEHKTNPRGILAGGDGSARFALEYRRQFGDWEAISDQGERLRAWWRMQDAVAEYRAAHPVAGGGPWVRERP